MTRPVDRCEQRSRHPGRSVQPGAERRARRRARTRISAGRSISFRYDPEWSHGFQNRPYNWEFSAGVQHELMPRMSVNAAYFRRIYGNFTRHRQRAGRRPATTRSYCVDGAGGRAAARRRRRADLRSARSATLARPASSTVDRVTTFASNYGDQFEHWNGVDLTVNARLPKLLLQGGVSTGRTYEDDCEVVRNVPEATPARPRPPPTATASAGRESPFLTQVKLLGAYTLPYDIQLSGTFQTSPGPEITASGTFVNAPDRAVARPQPVDRARASPSGWSSRRPSTASGCISSTSGSRRRFNVNRTRFQATAGPLQRAEREHGARAEQHLRRHRPARRPARRGSGRRRSSRPASSSSECR